MFTPNRLTPKAKPVDQRLSSRQRGYTHAWTKASKAFLAEHPLCHYCELMGRLVSATTVDHRDGHKDYETFWDVSKWLPSCKYHNDSKGDTPYSVYVERIKGAGVYQKAT